MRILRSYSFSHCRNMSKSKLNEAGWLIPLEKHAGDYCNCTKPYVPSVQEKRHRETEQTKIRRRRTRRLIRNYTVCLQEIRQRIKMKQDTWQPFNDKCRHPVDKDGIFLGQYGLIVSLSVQNGFKSAFLVVLSLPR